MPRAQKTAAAAAVAAERRFAMKTVAEVIGVARSNLRHHSRARSQAVSAQGIGRL